MYMSMLLSLRARDGKLKMSNPSVAEGNMHACKVLEADVDVEVPDPLDLTHYSAEASSVVPKPPGGNRPWKSRKRPRYTCYEI